MLNIQLHNFALNANGFILINSYFVSRSFRGTNHEFKENYYEDHRWFFALAAMLPPLDFVDTLLKGVPHLLTRGPLYIITILLMTILSIVAVVTKNQNYHKFFSIFFLIYISVFILINLNVLV